MLRIIFLLSLVLGIQGCAVQPKSPEIPIGPSATIIDTVTDASAGGAAFFYVSKVNGVDIKNSKESTMAATANRGMSMQTRVVERKLAAGKTKLQLSGGYAYAAPIQSIIGSLFSSAGDYSVVGELEFELRENVTYKVMGLMNAYRREVWLQDIATGEILGQKIEDKTGKKEMPPVGPDTLFTCCNLRYDKDWISDANWAGSPIIEAGSQIVLKEYGRNRASVEIEGRPMRIGLDYAREQHTIQDFIKQITVKSNPADKIAVYPEHIRKAVRAGKVVLGMTKEQALMALGYPRKDKTASTEANEWKYWTIDSEEYFLSWGPDQLLKKVDASRKVRQIVMIGD